MIWFLYGMSSLQGIITSECFFVFMLLKKLYEVQVFIPQHDLNPHLTCYCLIQQIAHFWHWSPWYGFSMVRVLFVFTLTLCLIIQFQICKPSNVFLIKVIIVAFHSLCWPSTFCKFLRDVLSVCAPNQFLLHGVVFGSMEKIDKDIALLLFYLNYKSVIFKRSGHEPQ